MNQVVIYLIYVYDIFNANITDAGSDVGAMSTVAIADGNNYILNGTKSWVTSGSVSKAAVIFATVGKSLKHKGEFI